MKSYALALLAVVELVGMPRLVQAQTTPPKLTAVTPRVVALKAEVVATLEGLEPWVAANPGQLSRIVLFLNGHQLKDANARWGGNNQLLFTLTRGLKSRSEWAALLGQPGTVPRTVRVQVGVEDQQPFPGMQSVDLDTLNGSYLLVAGAAFIALLVAFFHIARRTDLLREGGTPGANARRPFSLGRTQMAVWFFVVTASFVFIWIVTGSHDPLTPSVLGLIGLSAGTALGATVIDANKDSVVDNRGSALQTERRSLETEIASLRAATAEVQKAIATAPAGMDTAALVQQVVRGEADVAARLTRIQQIAIELRAVGDAVQPAQSHGFWQDVFSDENGVSFPRFQIGVWTLVLAVIFIYTVYDGLAMPDFDVKLLGLMGLSSGTYLGFKLPEAK